MRAPCCATPVALGNRLSLLSRLHLCLATVLIGRSFPLGVRWVLYAVPLGTAGVILATQSGLGVGLAGLSSQTGALGEYLLSLAFYYLLVRPGGMASRKGRGGRWRDWVS